MRLAFVVSNSVKTQRPTYTTVHLAFEAARRGHEVRFVGVDSMSTGAERGASPAGDDRVVGLASGAAHVGGATPTAMLEAMAAQPREEVCLNDFDVVFLRNNPHVTASVESGGDRYNPAIDFGRRLKRGDAMVVNDPDGLVRAGSKMYLAGFPQEIRPKTLISRNVEKIKDFLRELDGPAIIKPLAGFGGANVFYLRRGQVANLNQMISTVRKDGYIIAQEYLPEVARGDKRVLVLAGQPIRLGKRVAAYKRMRPKDDIRNNMHVGGHRRRCDFTEVEERICDLLRPRLVADGLYFVGVDVVGDKILEINVFAPGGIHNINELYGVNVGERIVEDLERRVAVRAAYQSSLGPDAWMRV